LTQAFIDPINTLMQGASGAIINGSIQAVTGKEAIAGPYDLSILQRNIEQITGGAVLPCRHRQ
jgi:hypothetical protein